MFRGNRLKITSIACLVGIFFGILLGDGTFINFRGEEVRRAIEQVGDARPTV